MRTATIIQARMTSTRLPEKVLRPLDFASGKTVLEEAIMRCKASKKVDEVIVATTNDGTERPILDLCDNLKIKYYKGSTDDVLSRYCETARKFGVDYIVRCTSDDPFIDPEVLDDLIAVCFDGGYEYVTNMLPPTYPYGISAEIIKFDTLEKVNKISTEKWHREHVTTYIHDNRDEFNIGVLTLPNGENYSDIRVSIDTEADYAAACALYKLLPKNYGWRDIVEIYSANPYLKMINDSSYQKKKYASIKDEIADAVKYLKLNGFASAGQILTERSK